MGASPPLRGPLSEGAVAQPCGGRLGEFTPLKTIYRSTPHRVMQSAQDVPPRAMGAAQPQTTIYTTPYYKQRRTLVDPSSNINDRLCPVVQAFILKYGIAGDLCAQLGEQLVVGVS